MARYIPALPQKTNRASQAILAEATFVCPAYWLATAYTGGAGKSSYSYQYSVPFAYHGSDVAAYFGPATPNQGPVFTQAFRKIWGNFITTGNPKPPSGPGIPSTWPAWTDGASPTLLNLNTTGGVPYRSQVIAWTVTQYMDPGLKNNFTLANARTWEGGRGNRCDFWKSIGPQVPE